MLLVCPARHGQLIQLEELAAASASQLSRYNLLQAAAKSFTRLSVKLEVGSTQSHQLFTPEEFSGHLL